ncbi:MAG: hypothetical protein U0263_05000 [Polyangiaceae bacterium]
MRRLAPVFVLSALWVSACGGSVSQEGSTGGSAGSGASSGTGASSGFGGGGSSGFGGGGSSGAGGVAGGPNCCSPGTKYDCETWGDGLECVDGVCKEPPPPGLCWSDQDCGVGGGMCVGASVCPCGAYCDSPDVMGKCTNGPGCCATDKDCAPTPMGPMVCVAGNCEMAPPPGKCWSQKDCSNGTTCSGQCVCPCGADCLCGGQMGSCEGVPPPPGTCCNSSFECGPGYVCGGGVCLVPIAGACWSDSECPANKKCVGASICPCGALCGMADSPGKCL